MNTDRHSSVDLARAVAKGLAGPDAPQAALYPPFVYLLPVAEALIDAGGHVALGAQDAYPGPDGAFTGEVSLAMLGDVGAASVLTGHSERRHVIGESDELVGRKTAAVLEAGLQCVLCVGEKLDEREAGVTDAVNERQLRAGLAAIKKDALARLVIAYEPVWAIGTGRTATPADAQDAHAKVRALLADMYDALTAASVRIIYGGSVKPASAESLIDQPDVDGFLVGGASLNAKDFLAICQAAGRASPRPQGAHR